jgi:hypothetical protein
MSWAEIGANSQIAVQNRAVRWHRLVRSDTQILADRALDCEGIIPVVTVITVQNPTLWRKCTGLCVGMCVRGNDQFGIPLP